MLHEPDRHEALRSIAWDAARARAVIARIVADTEARFSPQRYWPAHPLDLDPGDDAASIATPLYFGAAGVMWALDYLQAVGAAALGGDPLADPDTLLERNREWLNSAGSRDFASYLMGDTPILLMAYGRQPGAGLADRLATLIEGNIDHPARELMWGAPGTLLAALFLHERDGDVRWANLFRATAARLWSRLEWSDAHRCRYWTQDLYGQRSTYLDAVHGFVATASPLIRGRHLLASGDWEAWRDCIADTVTRTATWEGDRASWRPLLDVPFEGKKLMQFCHGAPGFVICLGDWPDAELDALLLAAGRATWAAGPLAKGSNLCHGTGGNGYVFLKLYLRMRDPLWLERARAFAMHGIEQFEADAARYGQLRYSLWTGDPGFAIYLWDCVQAQARFPTLDIFYGAAAEGTRQAAP
ncbi:MAG TPA: LanC-like protein [Burkholderiaceae bacterium]|nr:LanC-like protein [Burkholderiaceae bacterium]